MDNLILQARLFEKQMQQNGEQQDANGDGLDDKTGQPIKRVTTITEDINNKTGQVASKETKTKVINPTAEFDAQQADNRAVGGVATNLTTKSKDELINHFMIKQARGTAYERTWGRPAPEGYQEKVQTDFGSINPVDNTGTQPRDSANVNQPEQPVNQKPSMMDRMKGFGRGAGKVLGHTALGMATGGIGNLALNAYNKNQKNPTAPDPNAPAYMPVAGGAMSNLGNMGRGYLDSVTPKVLGGQGKPLTGDQGGLQGVWDNVIEGGANREGLTAEQTREQAAQYDEGTKQAIGDKRRDGINNPNNQNPPADGTTPPADGTTPPAGNSNFAQNEAQKILGQRSIDAAQEKMNTKGGFGTGLMSNLLTFGASGAMRGAYNRNQREQGQREMEALARGGGNFTNSYDLESKIHDLYSLQKQQSYYREIDSTEAIRFAHS